MKIPAGAEEVITERRRQTGESELKQNQESFLTN